jgi:hypothetical protein
MKARGKSSRSRSRSRTIRIVASSSFFAVALLLGTALAILPNPAVAEDGNCSDTTPDNRECTATEEFAYCLLDVFGEYADCLDEAGLLKKVGCGIEYELDTLTCMTDLAKALVK